MRTVKQEVLPAYGWWISIFFFYGSFPGASAIESPRGIRRPSSPSNRRIKIEKHISPPWLSPARESVVEINVNVMFAKRVERTSALWYNVCIVCEYIGNAFENIARNVPKRAFDALGNFSCGNFQQVLGVILRSRNGLSNANNFYVAAHITITRFYFSCNLIILHIIRVSDILNEDVP